MTDIYNVPFSCSPLFLFFSVNGKPPRALTLLGRGISKQDQVRFKSFTIQNYRAIDNATVEVGNRLIPLIGVNESGKTSVLQAIFAFDKFSDKFNQGKHLEVQNKYRYGKEECTIDAEVSIDSEEALRSLLSRLSHAEKSATADFFRQAYADSQAFTIRRNIGSKKYSLIDLDIPASLSERIGKKIYPELPFILYFDDFTDRVPETIAFSRSTKLRGYKRKTSRLAQWQKILEEIFRRATSGRELSEFIAIEEEDERDSLLNDVNDDLNDKVMQAWRDLKKSGSNLADDAKNLKLSLRYNPTETDFSFQFKVEDRDTSKGRQFNVTDRSKGFQWFFNFATKLKYNPKYSSAANGAIYLLDEPGSYLHSSAQGELLSMLKTIAETNTTIYCTHSEHLLDPQVINVSQIRIAEKQAGVISVFPFGSSSIKRAQGALTPLYHALRMRTSVFNRDFGHCVILEGITDFCFFDGLRRTTFKAWADIAFIPGAGASQLRELISLCITYARDFLILLDSDDAGWRAAKEYRKQFGAAVDSRVVNYGDSNGNQKTTLEDLLSDPDAERLKRITGCGALKEAMLAVYYGLEDRREEFFEQLDGESMAQIRAITGRISALASAGGKKRVT